jgi:hypothetical protein
MQEIPATAIIRMSDKADETHIGNFSHSEKAESYPKFVFCDMGSLEWCVSADWMLIPVLLLAGSSP